MNEDEIPVDPYFLASMRALNIPPSAWAEIEAAAARGDITRLKEIANRVPALAAELANELRLRKALVLAALAIARVDGVDDATIDAFARRVVARAREEIPTLDATLLVDEQRAIESFIAEARAEPEP